MFRQFATEDRALSRVGLFFCLAICAAVFFVSVRALPIKQAVPELGSNLHIGAKPSANAAIVIATPVAAAATVQSVPTAVPTVPAVASLPPVADAAPSTAPKPSVRAVSPPASATIAAEAKVYTVQAGDTLYGIARSHGATPQAIATLNGMSGTTTLKAGQRLLLP